MLIRDDAALGERLAETVREQAIVHWQLAGSGRLQVLSRHPLMPGPQMPFGVMAETGFSRRKLREWIARIDDSKLRVAVTERWDVLRNKSQP